VIVCCCVVLLLCCAVVVLLCVVAVVLLLLRCCVVLLLTFEICKNSVYLSNFVGWYRGLSPSEIQYQFHGHVSLLSLMRKADASSLSRETLTKPLDMKVKIFCWLWCVELCFSVIFVDLSALLFFSFLVVDSVVKMICFMLLLMFRV